MTYEQAIEITVTRQEAIMEIRKHGGTTKASQDRLVAEFLSEMGDKQEYLGSEVLDWLGY